MKSGLLVVALTACLQAAARPACPLADFFPATNPRADIDAVVTPPNPGIVQDDERLWFDLIEAGLWIFRPQDIYEVMVIKGPGGFRVGLLRPRVVPHEVLPRPGIVDSRALPASLAERIHAGLIPILARTHYPPALVSRPPRIEAPGGTWLYASVSDLEGSFGQLTGMARRPGWKDTDAGSVQALGQALRDYALHRIDEDGLEEPLELVETCARTVDQREPQP